MKGLFLLSLRMKVVVLLLFFALTACGSPRRNMEREAARAAKKLDREVAKAMPARASSWGYFSGPVETRWADDGLTMVVVSELRYTDPYGEAWVAPVGSRVNGASIPRAFWSLIGGPFDGKYRNASVLHDVAYDEQTRSWEDADRMFYNAMRCSGVGAVNGKDDVLRTAAPWPTLETSPSHPGEVHVRGARERDQAARCGPDPEVDRDERPES